MVDEVKFKICSVSAGHLRESGNCLGGELYHGEIKRVGLGQAVVSQIVSKP